MYFAIQSDASAHNIHFKCLTTVLTLQIKLAAITGYPTDSFTHAHWQTTAAPLGQNTSGLLLIWRNRN